MQKNLKLKVYKLEAKSKGQNPKLPCPISREINTYKGNGILKHMREAGTISRIFYRF